MEAIGDARARIRRLDGRLAGQERAVLAAACAWADPRQTSLYLVGGTVRDLLLERPHLDLDLAVAGDAPGLGRALAEAFGVEATVHEHFGTATLAGAGWALDLSRTRTEHYTYPGVLPAVSPAPIEQDLFRRDFTVNAIALSLNGTTTGELVDPAGGLVDLDRRVLRVLHDESFRDDPTRILRMARYAPRLAMVIDADTRRLAERDATYLRAISAARIMHELDRIFAETRPEEALQLLDAVHALRQVLPSLRLPAELAIAFERLRSDGSGDVGSAEYLALLAALSGRAAAEQLSDRLELRHDEIDALRAMPTATRVVNGLAGRTGAANPVAVIDALSSLPAAAVRAAGAALGGAAADVTRRYLQTWRHVRPILHGDDLVALGVERGPDVGRVLRLLRDGKLRAEIESRRQEESFVRRWLARSEPRGGTT